MITKKTKNLQIFKKKVYNQDYYYIDKKIFFKFLGEPATQMTLKSFHFAGVASMNIT